jgi:hypothetical protein
MERKEEQTIWQFNGITILQKDFYTCRIFPIILHNVEQGLNKDPKSIYHILILTWHDSHQDQVLATPAENTQQIMGHYLF